jgi:hypothetical protein
MSISDIQIIRDTFLADFRPGFSNSVSYAGHNLAKKGLAGRIKRKNVSAGHN